MARTITETITQFTNTETNVTRMVLRSETVSLRNNFRNIINGRIERNTSNLPYINNIENNDMIDTNTIIELNNSTTSERRVEFMESIISLENSDENRLFLIQNTSNQVRTYLHDLLIRSANNSNISEEDLYRIGNIFLYTISNLDIDGLILRDVIQNMRESMVIYNTNQIYSILENQISSHNQYLEEIRLASEQHIDERVEEFHREVDRKISLNRNKILITGAGILGSMALTSLGVPQIMSGLVARSMISPLTAVQSTPVEGVIRFRDVLDEGIKLFYNTIKSFNK